MSGSFHLIPPLTVSPIIHRCQSRSRRVQQRVSFRHRVFEMAEKAVTSLNDLYSSYAPSIAHVVDNFAYKHSSEALNLNSILSEVQVKRVHARILDSCFRVCRRGVPLPQCDDLAASLSDISPYLRRSAAPSFIDVESLALPERAGCVSLIDNLPPDLAAVYDSPSLLLRQEPLPAPKPCLLVKKGQYLPLIQRLHRSSMVTFIDNPIAVNGLFAVPKDDGAQRLVVDARPACAHFLPPASVSLPTADLIAEIELPSGAVLETAQDDVSNYFWNFRQFEWAVRYFALPPVRACDVGLTGDHLVYPALTVLPMGWSHSVLLAQSAHRHIIYSSTSLKPEDELIRGNDQRLDRLRHTICVDDVCFFDRVGSGRVAAAQQEYHAAMAARSLPLKLSKRVLPTSDPVKALGIEVRGAEGLVTIPIDRLFKLLRATETVIARKAVSGKLLSSLVGSWTWFMLIHRPLLSVFRSVYRFICCAGNETWSLWPSVVRELRTAIGLAPLLNVNLSASFFERVPAHDASEVGAGVVATRVDSRTLPFLSESIRRQQLAFHTAKEDQAEPVFIPARPVNVNGVLVRSLPVWDEPEFPAYLKSFMISSMSSWSDIISFPWIFPEHINRLEARAFHLAVRWLLKFPSAPGRRLITVSDSRVVTLAMAKGRSSSLQLMSRIRACAALLLAFGCKLQIAWVPSEVNPADAPSRRL